MKSNTIIYKGSSVEASEQDLTWARGVNSAAYKYQSMSSIHACPNLAGTNDYS